MGGILHLFDFNQAGNSGKLLMHARQLDGLEAPRNSLELPLESCQSLPTKDESIPYSYQVRHHSSKIGLYQGGTPMKLLIDREMSSETETRQSVPSVVARLMGVDKFPTDSKPPTYEGNHGFSSRSAVSEELIVSREFNYRKQDVLCNRNRQDPHDPGTSSKLLKSLVRDHPQEQELQKFKKDFETWQASKVWESSRGCGFDLGSGFWTDQRILAQERLNKEKLARHMGAKTNANNEKPPDIGHYNPSRSETRIQPEIDFLQGNNKRSLFQGNQFEALPMRNGNRSSNYEQTHSTKDDQQQTGPLPTRIVILKPGPERFDDSDDSQAVSETAIGEEGSIEDFLEEVKARLIHGIRDNATKDTKWHNNEIKSAYFGRPTDPKEIAQQIAKQVRDSVTRDMGLPRSESTRSQRTDVQIGRLGSPEFINRDTRKFLSERLKNVLRNDTDVDMHKMVKSGSMRTSIFSEGPLAIGPEFSKTGKKVDRLNDMQNVAGLKARSFRYDMKNETRFNRDVVSPRSLIRSMSAPVTGTAFGKLLLEDQPILTGAHIRRKHEMPDKVSVERRKNKKSRFNFKGTVSNLRYSLRLRGKFFSKKIQSMERGVDGFGLTRTALTVTIPSLARNLNVQENSTEVPPSPASVSSDSQERLFGGPTNHSSPVSTLDVPFSEDLSVPDAFQEISSNLRELKQQIDQLDFKRTGMLSQGGSDEDVDVEEEALYLRDVLVAAGILKDLDGILSMWDSSTAPIKSCIFEEVEEAYRKKSKQHQGSMQDSNDSELERKLLFDLLNEALETKLGLVASDITLSKSFQGSTVIVPSSKQLHDDVCEMVRMCIHPPSTGDETIEGLVVKDIETTRWMGMMHGDVYSIGRDMEKMILHELVEEVVSEYAVNQA